MRSVLKVVGFLLAACLLVSVGVAGTAFAFKRLPFQTETIDRSQPTLLKSIQDISQFHGAVGNFEVVLDHEDDVKWVPGFIAGKRTLFVAAGTVNAYVDFSILAEEDMTVSEDGTSVTIRLPKAHLDKPNLDQERTYVYSQERGVVNRIGDAISPQDQQKFYLLSEQRLAEAAAQSELTKQAETNTKAMLEGMLDALDIEVTFVGDR